MLTDIYSPCTDNMVSHTSPKENIPSRYTGGDVNVREELFPTTTKMCRPSKDFSAITGSLPASLMVTWRGYSGAVVIRHLSSLA